MLYALDSSQVARLRASLSTAQFAGAEVLHAVYRTDPAVVARVLPKPLRMAEPIAVAFVAHYPETNFGPGYNEGALFVQAALGREIGLYCLAMPVDDDMAMAAGREVFGFPKKMAERITLEKTGTRILGRVVRKGIEILKIETNADSPAEPDDLGAMGAAAVDDTGQPCRQVVSFLFKFFMRPDLKGFDYLPRLIRQATLLRPRAELKRGSGSVVVRSSACDPLGAIPVMGESVRCLYGIWDNTMMPGRVLRRVWNLPRFLPHAFFKTDFAPTLLGSTSLSSKTARSGGGSS